MKRPLLFSMLVLPALFFLSCNNAGNTAGAGSPAADTTVGVENPDMYHGGGHSVPWAHIKPCIDAYIDTMARYGINADSPRQKLTRCPDSTYMITTSESFRADSLMAYLKQQIAKYDPSGKGANLNFVIYPGIRTVPMLNAVNMATGTAGRITYFIVPDTSSTATVNARKAAKAAKTSGVHALDAPPPPGDGGGSGFEVGGIHP